MLTCCFWVDYEPHSHCCDVANRVYAGSFFACKFLRKVLRVQIVNVTPYSLAVSYLNTQAGVLVVLRVVQMRDG